MPKSKVVNHQEVVRWFEEGRTYDWMIQKYRDKYNVETASGMWGNYRYRHGLARRTNRDYELIPWFVDEKHRWHHDVNMLRAEARRRAGMPVAHVTERKLESWLTNLKEKGLVVHYDPNSEEGFVRIPPRPGIDTDLIRVPRHKTTRRRRLD